MTVMTVFRAFLRRDWAINRSYRLAFVTESFSASLSVVTFFFVGRFVDRAHFGSGMLSEHGYFPFVIVGILLMNMIGFMVYSFQSSLIELQKLGTLEAMLATPPSSASLIVAGPAFDFIRVSAMQLLVLLGSILFLGARFQHDALALGGGLVAATACIAIFAAVGLGLAGGTLFVKRGATQIVHFGMSGMIILGGVYYPTSVLPRPLSLLSQCLPLTWAVEATRSALLDGTLMPERLLLLVVTAVLSIPASVWFFNVCLNRARREGSLTHY